ncbi:MAG: hypothetical protein K6T91_08890 [Firmicutes bacterium]|nr:hypothetical protein [Bacillota bacterium]
MLKQHGFVFMWPVYESYGIDKGYIKARSNFVLSNYNPISSDELFLAIQRVDTSKERSILKFVSRYGLLTNKSEELIAEFKEKIAECRLVLTACAVISRTEKGSLTEKDKHYLQEFIAASPSSYQPAGSFIEIAKSLVYTTIGEKLKGVSFTAVPQKSGFARNAEFSSLLQAFYFRIYLDMTTDSKSLEYRICDNPACSRVFSAGPKGIRRYDAKTCSDTCSKAR